jgi:ribonuclease BN (tRNA processing enzyme)
MKKAEILATKKELQEKGKSNIKDFTNTHWALGYENQVDKLQYKEVSEDWRVDWFSQDKNGVGIDEQIRQGLLGIPADCIVYSGDKKRSIKIAETLINAEKLGHIVIINNPDKKSEKKEVK